MTIEYVPKGTCSRRMTIEAENGVIGSVKIEGGCRATCREYPVWSRV